MADETPRIKPKRMWQRRWTRPCKDCGEILVFLDETRPPINGKPRSPWAIVEVFGVRDGEPAFWDGSIAYNPATHVLHTSCPRVKRRLAWILRQKEYDI